MRTDVLDIAHGTLQAERRRWRPPAPVVAGGGLAVALAVALLVAPPLGTDLSAQVARADFAREYGVLTPVDLRWYGGTVQYGYSWLSPAVMALLGARVTGALALVVSAMALAVLLLRCGARRPVTATLLGAVAFAGNLVSGRVTFALGVAVGLLALVALAPGGAAGGRRGPGGTPVRRLVPAAIAAVAASATSPVAGLFLALVGAALVGAAVIVTLPPGAGPGASPGRARRGWHGWRSDRRIADGGVLAVAAAAPIGLTALLAGAGGVMNISGTDTLHAVVAGLLVAAVVRPPVLRIGAVLSSAMVLGAYLVPSPVGLNATRLAIMFALPAVAGYARVPERFPRHLVVPLLLATALWQPPVLFGDLADAGNPTAQRAYFAPLVTQLRHHRPVGRVEAVPTRDYWEAAYLADVVPLARGWLRQVDIARNPLFFDGGLDAGRYRAWLVDNGVAYVALPDAELSWVGRGEAEVIRERPGYLREIWRGEHWTLFEVAGSPSIVDGATLVAATGAAVTFDVTVPGEVLVRVAPSRWLQVTGPTPVEPTARGRWTALRVERPGRYTITS